MKLFVAVVVSSDDDESRRNDGSWAAFVSENQDDVVQQALTCMERWPLTSVHYKALIGSLVYEVLPNRYYQLKSLIDPDGGESESSGE